MCTTLSRRSKHALSKSPGTYWQTDIHTWNHVNMIFNNFRNNSPLSQHAHAMDVLYGQDQTYSGLPADIGYMLQIWQVIDNKLVVKRAVVERALSVHITKTGNWLDNHRSESEIDLHESGCWKQLRLLADQIDVQSWQFLSPMHSLPNESVRVPPDAVDSQLPPTRTVICSHKCHIR